MEHLAKIKSFYVKFRHFRFRHWPTVIVFVLGLTTTLIIASVRERTDLQELNTQQSARIASRIKTISAELHRYEDLVKAVQAIAEASRGLIDLDEYRIVASHLLRDRDGIQALDYAPRVLSAERNTFEANARGHGLIGYQIKSDNHANGVETEGERSEYFPIYDLFPVEGNEIALGLDAAAARAPIFDLAARTGDILASPPIRLVDDEKQWAFLLVGPVYGPLTANTVEERRAKLKGYAIGVFRIGAMFESILRNATVERGFDHYIFDGSPEHPGQLLYTHASRLRKAGELVAPFEQVHKSDAYTDSIRFDQHEWTVITVPLATRYSLLPGIDVITVLIFGLVCTVIDSFYRLSAQRRAEGLNALTAKVVESEDRLRTIFDSVSEGVFVSDPDTGAFLDVNPSACKLFGYERDELIGRNIADISSGVSNNTLSTALKRLKSLIAGEPRLFEWQCKAKDGRLFWAEIALRTAPIGSKIVALATLRDITERRQIQEHLINVAKYDELTGLVNRTEFLESLKQAATRARRDAHFFGVLYLDLDHFKDINDTLGHPVGDQILKLVADRLRSTVRESDTVARFGGDEFAVLAAELEEPTGAGVLAMKLVAALQEPFVIEGNVIHTGTSIGIAIFDIDSPVVETLLAHADLAMYRAKSVGGGGFKFFTDAMDAEVRERVSLAKDLHEAIASESLVLFYQPQVEMASGRILGVEALVRWPHPTRGMLAPANFIAAAEKSGLIIQLGRWILREACRQAKAWLDAGIAPIVMGVNFSTIQFRAPLEVENDIITALAETRLPAHCLEIELTETALMVASREHNVVLQRIHDSGVKLAIDDFGTGYSSLDYLRRYPVDRIKIAQTFVADITTDAGDVAIVRATIGLARELKIGLIAEGVETREQRDLLVDWGCLNAQGFYFSEPLSAGDIERVLRDGRLTSIRRPSMVPAI